MKVIVTHMKAPWPAGVKVGDCVALAAAVLPAWAKGKCEPAADGAEPVALWEPAAAPAEPEPEPSPADIAQRHYEEALQAIHLAEVRQQQALEEVRQQLAAVAEQLQAALTQIEELKAAKPEAAPVAAPQAAAEAPAQADPAPAPAPAPTKGKKA